MAPDPAPLAMPGKMDDYLWIPIGSARGGTRRVERGKPEMPLDDMILIGIV